MKFCLEYFISTQFSFEEQYNFFQKEQSWSKEVLNGWFLTKKQGKTYLWGWGVGGGGWGCTVDNFEQFCAISKVPMVLIKETTY